MSVLLRRENIQVSEQGSILVYCVIFILFLSSLGFFFRVTSMPTVTPTADTRRLYETQYIMDSAKTVIRSQLLSFSGSSLTKDSIREELNSFKTITVSDSNGKKMTLTRVTSVQNSNIEIAGNDFGSTRTVIVKDMKFKIKLSDGSLVRRTRTWVFVIEQ